MTKVRPLNSQPSTINSQRCRAAFTLIRTAHRRRYHRAVADVVRPGVHVRQRRHRRYQRRSCYSVYWLWWHREDLSPVKKRFTSAFSLVELTLALGIAAFCLLAVFGLIPVAALTNRNATSQTAATNIMNAVVSDLRAAPTTKTKSSQFQITFATSGTQTLYFDASGTASISLTANSRYQLNVTWSNSSWNGLLYADVKVWWPAAATAANASGSTEMFAAFDRN